METANKVNVIRATISDVCTTKPNHKSRCKNKPFYMICNEDGEPKSSRLFATPCKKHLDLAIKNAWEDNIKINNRNDRNRIKNLKKELNKLTKRKK